MELLNYFIAVILVSLGLILGVIIGKMTKEELKPGKKYFVLMQTAIIFIMIFYASMFNLSAYISVILAFLLLLKISNFRLTEEPKLGFYYLAYLCFAFTFFESSINASLIIFPSLIFIFGLPTGSLLLNRKKKIKHAFILLGFFFVISMILILLKILLIS